MIEQDWVSMLAIKIVLVEVVAYTWWYMVFNTMKMIKEKK